MNNFLREVRRLKSVQENLCLVIGNESCDLDSAVCSLSLAYYYNQLKEAIPSRKKKNITALPVLNILREELPLRTEVCHVFKKYSIDIDALTFKDDLDDAYIKNSDIVLVDHHVSPYVESVLEVYDHRAFDVSSNLPKNCKMHLELIGSCSSLIANLFLKLENPEKYEEPLRLLYGAILLDTVNFCKNADRARQLDVDVVNEIEKIFKITNPIEYRLALFDELVLERANCSNLNSYQVLFKDMKLISDASGKRKVAIPGFPMLVQDYIHMELAEENLKKFIKEKECSVVVLMGMKVTNGVVERDLGFINESDAELYNLILQNAESKEHNLDLAHHENCKFLEGKFFAQKNIKASRKQILPMVKNILNNL